MQKEKHMEQIDREDLEKIKELTNAFYEAMPPKKNKRLNKILVIICLLLLILLGYGIYDLSRVEMEDLRYKVVTNEYQTPVEVVNIIKEKGKEPQYIINTTYEKTSIPESIYLQYIGDENNAITIKETRMYIYIGAPQAFGEPASFSSENWWDASSFDYISRYRFSYPWEEAVIPYEEEQVKEVAFAYISKEIESNGSTSAVPEDIKKFN